MKKLIISACIVAAAGQIGKAKNSVAYTNTTIITPIKLAEGQKVVYSFTIFQNSDSTYGYHILANGNIYFKQPNYPGKTIGFETATHAKYVAKAVIYALEAKTNLPTIALPI